MPTVQELSAPYENHLVPVLPSGPGVCPVCHSFFDDDYFDRCYQCNEAQRRLPATCDALAFVALAVKGQQLARELAVYKGTNPVAAARPRPGLAAVLWKWMSIHEDCLTDVVGVGQFPIVTTIPSTGGRASHPLEHVVGEVVGATKDRYQPLLRARTTAPGDRSFNLDRFEVTTDVSEGEAILLIDDTFTTGSRIQSAAAALRQGGSGPVGALCIGRHFNRNPAGESYREAAEAYYKRARALGWSWDRCCLER